MTDLKKIIPRILALFFMVAVGTTALADSANYIVIDVRTPEEYSSSHIKNTLNIDFLKPDFKEQIIKLDKTKTYKLYCHSGNRSGKAMDLMKTLGFTNIENLGSLRDASKKLNLTCEGLSGC